jgi:molybdopterin adenylyltransferase
MTNTLKIGLVSVSDRASSGEYQDAGLPALQDWFTRALSSPWQSLTRLIPDEQEQIEATLIDLSDAEGCHLILTTGGTGPAPRDVTPEATLAVAHKVLPGFGEQMRAVSLKYVPTAIHRNQHRSNRGVPPEIGATGKIDRGQFNSREIYQDCCTTGELSGRLFAHVYLLT